MSDVSIAPLDATVLVVEDDPALRTATQRLLAPHVTTLHVASNGVEAHRVAMSLQRLDLLLTDVVLPDIPGLQVADLIRLYHPTVRIFVMSGYLENHVTTEETVFLKKPFDGPTLVARVREILQSVPARRTRRGVRAPASHA
jgi:two-component system cell cycle sensor histidine kinase/response regulator CckA